jgi:hypothetical protein
MNVYLFKIKKLVFFKIFIIIILFILTFDFILFIRFLKMNEIKYEIGRKDENFIFEDQNQIAINNYLSNENN